MNPPFELYESYAASGYGQYLVPLDSQPVDQYEANHLRYLSPHRDAAILDVGCGAGHYLHWLCHLGYRNVLGVDASTVAVAHCEAHRLPARHVEDLGAMLRDADERYETIVMNDVIEHIDQHKLLDVLLAAHSALQPGGCLLVKTLNMASRGGLYLRYADLTHTGGFTEHSLRQALAAAGFSSIDVRPYVFPRGGPKRNAWLVAQRVTSAWAAAMYFVELGVDRPRVRSKLVFAVGRK